MQYWKNDIIYESLRKGNKIKIATKTLSHKDTQSVGYDLYTLCVSLSLCGSPDSYRDRLFGIDSYIMI